MIEICASYDKLVFKLSRAVLSFTYQVRVFSVPDGLDFDIVRVHSDDAKSSLESFRNLQA